MFLLSKITAFDRLALIDLGSSAIKCIVFNKQGHELHRHSESIGLGEDMKTHGQISESKIHETLFFIQSQLQNCLNHNIPPTHIRIVATAAIREAQNRTSLMQAYGVIQNYGIPLEIISHQDEALYGIADVLRQCPSFDTGLSVEMGGGSTQVWYVRNREPQIFFGLDIGGKNSQKPHFGPSILYRQSLQSLKQHIQKELHQINLPHLKKIPALQLTGGVYFKLGKYLLGDPSADDFSEIKLTPQQILELTANIENYEKSFERFRQYHFGQNINIKSFQSFVIGQVLLKLLMHTFTPQHISIVAGGFQSGLMHEMIQNLG